MPPIHEYECPKCGKEQEVLQRHDAEPPKCFACDVPMDKNGNLVGKKITSGMHARFPDDNNVRPMLLQPFKNSNLYGYRK